MNEIKKKISTNRIRIRGCGRIAAELRKQQKLDIASSGGFMFELRVYHKISEAARKQEAQTGNFVKEINGTSFNAPFPDIVMQFARFIEDHEYAEINLATAHEGRKAKFSIKYNPPHMITTRTSTVDGFRDELPSRSFSYLHGTEYSTVESIGLNIMMNEVVDALAPCVMTKEMEDMNAATLQDEESYRLKVQEAMQMQREKDEQERQRQLEIRFQKVEVFREWAIKNGSDLLRKRACGGFEWLPLARREYAKHNIDATMTNIGLVEIDLDDDVDCNINERTTPTLEEMEWLERVRAAAMQEVTARLVWVKYNDMQRTELKVTSETPDGSKSLYFEIPDNN